MGIITVEGVARYLLGCGWRAHIGPRAWVSPTGKMVTARQVKAVIDGSGTGLLTAEAGAEVGGLAAADHIQAMDRSTGAVGGSA